MKIALIFTNDWELFGDGSGNYYEIQHEPLEKMLYIVDKYKAKITVLAEVGQQLNHIRIAEDHEWAAEIVESWENILKQTIKTGNDVQLHYHPQWDGSIYDSMWKLTENWTIANYDKFKINEFIRNGKEYLESLFKPINNDYNCVCFRAGAYYIEPSKRVIPELLENGFECDTSVTKGLKSTGNYDFSDALSNIVPWETKIDGIKYKGDSGLFEIPIYSFKGIDSEVLKKFFPKVYYKIKYGLLPSNEELQWASERDRIKNKRYPVKNRLYKKSQNKNFVWYMKAILNTKYTQLDYDYIPASVFVENLKRILSDKVLNDKIGNGIIPVVASGHVKDMHSPYNFERILQLIRTELSEDIEFWTLTEAIKHLKSI